eukprot:TRINITY_DN6014_c0_g1_i1.p1 TRINITY_DN6014_c0_g1~~TRINITY_DN6014_c0_g1_i1.p1  ORF type:complete len:215 (-),score=29.16 TRINITY_DN6014_c0_g1_i1:176-754(-)
MALRGGLEGTSPLAFAFPHLQLPRHDVADVAVSSRPSSAPRSVQRKAVGSTLDRPPPPAQTSDGDGEEEYEFRWLTNDEREYHASMWLPLANEQERSVLEDGILTFKSNTSYVGRLRKCLGVFIGQNCMGMATMEIGPDLSDFGSFIMQRQTLKCQTVASRPGGGSGTGGVLVKALKQVAQDMGYKLTLEGL